MENSLHTLFSSEKVALLKGASSFSQLEKWASGSVTAETLPAARTMIMKQSILELETLFLIWERFETQSRQGFSNPFAPLQPDFLQRSRSLLRNFVHQEDNSQALVIALTIINRLYEDPSDLRLLTNLYRSVENKKDKDEVFFHLVSLIPNATMTRTIADQLLPILTSKLEEGAPYRHAVLDVIPLFDQQALADEVLQWVVDPGFLSWKEKTTLLISIFTKGRQAYRKDLHRIKRDLIQVLNHILHHNPTDTYQNEILTTSIHDYFELTNLIESTSEVVKEAEKQPDCVELIDRFPYPWEEKYLACCVSIVSASIPEKEVLLERLKECEDYCAFELVVAQLLLQKSYLLAESTVFEQFIAHWRNGAELMVQSAGWMGEWIRAAMEKVDPSSGRGESI